jgi:hypothetical protein
MSGFQRQVNQVPAPAVEGDFCDNNPRATVNAGPGGLVTGPEGMTVGRFGWVAADGKTAHSFATAAVAPWGILGREQQALITEYLGEASMIVPGGFGITLFDDGGFWMRNQGPSAMVYGTQIYASYENGGAYTAAPSGAAATGIIGSTNTGAMGSTSTGTAVVGEASQITLSAVTGLISIGEELAGTGITAGTTILSQISGTTGGAGVYQLSENNTAAAATITSFGDVLVISATTGLISIGDTVAGGAGFPAGAVVVSQISGTAGGAGVYQLSGTATAYVASETGVTTFGAVLNVTAIASGVLAPGNALTGSGIPAGANIASQVSGNPGGVGVYTITIPQTAYAASASFTTVGGISATGWLAKSAAAVGELVKVSTW